MGETMGSYNSVGQFPGQFLLMHLIGWLVVSTCFNPSEKYEDSSIGMRISNIWKNKKCSKPPTSWGWDTILHTVQKIQLNTLCLRVWQIAWKEMIVIFLSHFLGQPLQSFQIVPCWLEATETITRTIVTIYKYPFAKSGVPYVCNIISTVPNYTHQWRRKNKCLRTTCSASRACHCRHLPITPNQSLHIMHFLHKYCLSRIYPSPKPPKKHQKNASLSLATQWTLLLKCSKSSGRS